MRVSNENMKTFLDSRPKTDLKRSVLSIADIAVEFIYDVPFLNDFPPDSYFYRTGKKPVASVCLLEGDESDIDFLPHSKDVYCIISKKTIAQNNQGQLARDLLAYIAGLNSDRYDSVHACGIALDYSGHRGALFIGPNGTGKSTIQKMFDKSPYIEDGLLTWDPCRHKVLDDDLLMISKNSMHRAGKFRRGTIEIDGNKSLAYAAGGIKQYPIDAVFLLTKEMGGGETIRSVPVIPRAYSCITSLPPHITEPYLSSPPIRVEAPVYLLGTDGNPEKTKETIERIVSGL